MNKLTPLNVKNAEPECRDFNATVTEILPNKGNAESEYKGIGGDRPADSVTPFSLDPAVSENASQMANIILRLLVDHDAVLVCSIDGKPGVSQYKTDGKDIQAIYKKLTTGGKRSVIIAPYLNNIPIPDCQ